MDQSSRTRGYAQVADRLWSLLTVEQKEIFAAYAEGLNAYIDAVQARDLPPPSELSLAAVALNGGRPAELMKHVDARDVVAFAALIVFQLGYESSDLANEGVENRLHSAFEGDAQQELRRQGALEDLWARVQPIKAVSAAPSGFGLENGLETAANRSKGRHRQRTRRGRSHARTQDDASTAAAVPGATLSRLLEAEEAHAALLHGGMDADFGSNAWAIMGRHSQDGSTLLAGDGHLPLSVPTLFYPMGLHLAADEARPALDVFGLFFPGYPFMAVGTNGSIAWSQTYLEGDVTDWYAEEIELDSSGIPASSRDGLVFRPLSKVSETYVIANVPALMSEGRAETWDRFETFDGRHIVAIEGSPAAKGAQAGDGAVINVLGENVVPQDIDGDGVISAVSFDFTGFDISNIPAVSEQFSRARSVSEFREATRRLVAYAQNLIAADRDGNVYYGSYNATPCREYLEKGPDSRWTDGSNPMRLVDGRRYRGFTIPLDARGFPDETSGEKDPYKCMVPFARWPAVLSPARGYVATANNDIAGLASDDSLSNDAYYLGGPFAPGYRAHTITERLAELAASDSASLDAMAHLQNDHRSLFLAEVAEHFLRALGRAEELVAESRTRTLNEDEARLLSLYLADFDGVVEVEGRVRTWLERGADARSGVDTFYSPDEGAEGPRLDAIATMIMAEWTRTFAHVIFDDEDISYLFEPNSRFLMSAALTRLLEARGQPENATQLRSWNTDTRESIFFDVRGTDRFETSDEDILVALVRALENLRAPPTAPGVGGFGTEDMNEWRWGLRHLVRFPSLLEQYGGGDAMVSALAGGFSITPRMLPLDRDLAPDDPRANLPGFPRPGAFFAVDAANPSFLGSDYFYTEGPVMRMTFALSSEGRVTGRCVIPGGQSALTNSAHHDDQVALWLANEAAPIRFHLDQVIEGATHRDILHP